MSICFVVKHANRYGCWEKTHYPKDIPIFTAWFTGPKSLIRACTQGVPSHLRSIYAILAVDNMEVGTYHFTSPSPKSQVWLGCLHGNTFWRWGSGLVLSVGSSKLLDWTLNTHPVNIYAQNNSEPTFMIINPTIPMISWSWKVGTSPPCWELGTC